MSTRTALTVVGGIVGAYFGYPQLGFALGALVGGVVDPEQIQGPKIGEVNVQTSAEGVARPIIYGTYPTYGNVIQIGPTIIVETSESQGKGGPEVNSEKAYRTFAIRICEGPIGGILRVWEDNKLVYDVRTGSGMLAESALWAQNKIFYLGGEDQLPDPTLVSTVNEDTPAYRGSAYMVAVLEDVSARQGSISQYRYEVAKLIEPPSVQDLSAQANIPVYASGGIPSHPFVHLARLPSTHLNYSTDVLVGTIAFNAWLKDGSNTYSLLDVDDSCATVSTVSQTVQGSSFSALSPPSSSNSYFPYATDGSLVMALGTTYQAGRQLFMLNGGELHSILVPDSAASSFWYADNANTDAYVQRYAWITGSRIYLGVPKRTTGSGTTNYNCVYLWPTLAGGAPDYRVNPIAVLNGVCATPGAHFLMHVGNDGRVRVINDIGEYKVYSPTLVLESSETLPFSIYGIDGFGVDGNTAVFIRSISNDGGPTSSMYVRSTSDWSLKSTFANAVFGTKIVGTRVVFTDSSVYIKCQDTVLRAAYVNSLVGLPTTLGAIVSDIHNRCGSDSATFDVSELTDEVAGFGLAGDYTGASGIDTLRPVYQFDKSLHDGKFWYPKRGAAVIETLTVDDLTEVPDTTKREQALDVPRKLHLKYQHAASGYAPVQANAPRTPSPDFLTTGEASIEIPVVIDENQAAQCVDKMYKVMRAEQAGTTEIGVPLDVAAKYAEGNCIGLSLRGRVTRQRIEQMDFADWKVKLTLKPDRQSAYTSNLTGVPIPEPTLPPSTIVGDTEMAILDIAARVDSEDKLGYLVAVDGALPPWYGARYQRSFDGGASFATVGDDIRTASVMGVLVDAVPAASEYFTDTTNTVRVQLYRATHSLESITDQQFLSEQGAFALEKDDGSWEIMQYRDADDEGSGVYALTVLHRGQLNSGSSAHAAGARFVMLDRPRYEDAQASWIGVDITHRAISLGSNADDTTNEETAIFVGRSQLEWPVAYLELERDVSDNVSGTWTPRHRFGSDDAPVASINFQGYRVTIDDGVLPAVTFDTATPSFTYDASGLSSSVTVTVSALNRITGAGPTTSGTV